MNIRKTLTFISVWTGKFGVSSILVWRVAREAARVRDVVVV